VACMRKLKKYLPWPKGALQLTSGADKAVL
jgi:hypothetical protein